MNNRRHVAMVAAAGLLVASCGSSSNKAGSSGTSGGGAQSGVVTIANTQGQTWTCGFNPFNPAVNSVSFGPVCEPLVFVNALKSEEATPMLASDYAFPRCATDDPLLYDVDGVLARCLLHEPVVTS